MLNAIFREIIAAAILVGASAAISLPFLLPAHRKFKRKQAAAELAARRAR